MTARDDRALDEALYTGLYRSRDQNFYLNWQRPKRAKIFLWNWKKISPEYLYDKIYLTTKKV